MSVLPRAGSWTRGAQSRALAMLKSWEAMLLCEHRGEETLLSGTGG